MRVRFNGGPWDGLEFDAPFCPDVIRFHDLDVRMDRVEGEPLAFTMHSAKREHHQYLFDQPKLLGGVTLQVGVNLEREPEQGESIIDLADKSVIVMHYRYAPGAKVWWEE